MQILYLFVSFSLLRVSKSQSSAECSALADLWNATKGSSWTNKWPSQPATSGCSAVCGWYGITCSGGSSGSITQM